jgi:hypothetical protein
LTVFEFERLYLTTGPIPIKSGIIQKAVGKNQIRVKVAALVREYNINLTLSAFEDEFAISFHEALEINKSSAG